MQYCCKNKFCWCWFMVVYLCNKTQQAMTQQQMTQVVMNRASEMLKDSQINAIYQSFKIESEAKDWIIKAALATLIIPVENRG